MLPASTWCWQQCSQWFPKQRWQQQQQQPQLQEILQQQ
jgi:hypothetical protein